MHTKTLLTVLLLCATCLLATTAKADEPQENQIQSLWTTTRVFQAYEEQLPYRDPALVQLALESISGYALLDVELFEARHILTLDVGPSIAMTRVVDTTPVTVNATMDYDTQGRSSYALELPDTPKLSGFLDADVENGHWVGIIRIANDGEVLIWGNLPGDNPPPDFNPIMGQDAESCRCPIPGKACTKENCNEPNSKQCATDGLGNPRYCKYMMVNPPPPDSGGSCGITSAVSPHVPAAGEEANPLVIPVSYMQTVLPYTLMGMWFVKVAYVRRQRRRSKAKRA